MSRDGTKRLSTVICRSRACIGPRRALRSTPRCWPTCRAARAGRLHTDQYQRRAARTIELRLGVRPWQVNPPAQFLSQQGGFSPIARSSWRAAAARHHPSARGRRSAGRPPSVARRRADPVDSARSDPLAAWTATRSAPNCLIRVTLAPGETRRFVHWRCRRTVPRRRWSVPIADTLAHWRAGAGRVAITRAAGQAGVRRHRRSSLRAHADQPRRADAQARHAQLQPRMDPRRRDDVAKRCCEWAAPTSRAISPTGIAAICSPTARCRAASISAAPIRCRKMTARASISSSSAELYRYTGDRAALERDWPSVLGAVRYMDKLRRSERTPANLTPGRRMLYGLMPPSISHEGYSAKPQYSLWDDFWALRGYKDAADIATWLGKPEAAQDCCVARRVRRRPPRRDPAPRAIIGRSTIFPAPPASAISTRPRPPSPSTPAASRRGSIRRMLDDTFERYWSEFRRARGGTTWKDYTPYETAQWSALRPARLARSGRCVARILHGGPAADRRGTSGPKSSAVTRAKSASSATCRMPGSHRTSSAPRSTCSLMKSAMTTPGTRRGLAGDGWRARVRRSAGWRRLMARSISRCAATPRRSHARPSAARARPPGRFRPRTGRSPRPRPRRASTADPRAWRDGDRSTSRQPAQTDPASRSDHDRRSLRPTHKDDR